MVHCTQQAKLKSPLTPMTFHPKNQSFLELLKKNVCVSVWKKWAFTEIDGVCEIYDVNIYNKKNNNN